MDTYPNDRCTSRAAPSAVADPRAELVAAVERRAIAMESSFRDSLFRLQRGISSLHDAIDAALGDDTTGVAEHLGAGLGDLRGCDDELTALGEALMRARAELFERGDVDPGDPLVAREPFFAQVDYEAIYRDLLAHGAALPQHVFWDDVASRLRQGGAHGGLRLLDRQLRELQSGLRGFIAGVEDTRRLRGRVFAAALHDSSLDVAALMLGYTRVLTTFTYFTILCERASALYERSLGSGERASLAG